MSAPKASLAELAGRYMPAPTAACPLFVESSAFEPVIDGVTYFTELHHLTAELAEGDAVYIASYQADPCST
jgi:hypothetical protein